MDGFVTDWLTLTWSGALGGILLAWLGIAERLWRVQRRTPALEPATVPAVADAAWPAVSVIVPARNEAAHVEPALRSLLAQDYLALEVIAVNDRSQDATGTILEGLAAGDSRLRVRHVAALPAGWLGKTHACHLGAQEAQGEWLLFTDADVVFAPDALRAALAFASRHGLGHLVAAPRLLAPGYWERAFQALFAVYFALRCRLWALRRPGSRAYVGMGAFNLVRRAAYLRAGGHARLALSVVDDVQLGLLLRRSGVPQGFASAQSLLAVRWQAGFWATLRGLLKNIFADTGYRWDVSLGATAAVLLLGLLPWAGLAFAPSVALRALALPSALLPMLLLGVAARRASNGSGLEGLVAPLMHAALAGTILLSALLVTLRGGLTWRGTVYPLADLRAGRLRARDLTPHNAVGW